MKGKLLLNGMLVGGVIFSVLGIILMLSVYVPDYYWNESAVKGKCHREARVYQGFCNQGGCFEVYIFRNVVNTTCWDRQDAGIFNTKEQADAWASTFGPIDYPCYYQNSNVCDFSTNLRNTRTDLIISLVFLGIGFFLFAWPILVIFCSRYEEL
jgi:hypothetical protein